jgi:hypothetical protein
LPVFVVVIGRLLPVFAVKCAMSVPWNIELNGTKQPMVAGRIEICRGTIWLFPHLASLHEC